MLDSYQNQAFSIHWTSPKMSDLNGTNGRQKDGSANNRPFYELPAHIKPCSKIIQETRMQLKYSNKLGSSEIPFGNTGQLCNDGGPGGGDNFSRRGSTSDLYNGHVVELPNIHSESGYGGGNRFGSNSGIRPVDTKRPFTPRDSVSLWGVSARKRPPSAITLSRLAIDENEEGGAVSSVVEENNHHGGVSESNNSHHHQNAKYQRVPKASLGKVPKLQSAAAAGTGRSSYSFDSATEILGGLNMKSPPSSLGKVGREVEKARLHLKSLSLQNDSCCTTASSFDIDQSSTTTNGNAFIGSSSDKYEYDSASATLINDHNLTYHAKNQPHHHQAKATTVPGHGTSQLICTNDEHVKNGSSSRSTMMMMNASDSVRTNLGDNDSYNNIDCLDDAITYLQSLVTHLTASSSDKNVRGEIIDVLKRVRLHIADVHKSPQLKIKLLRLIFKLVEKNQTDEDILFWASFVLLHCNIVGNNLTTIFKMVFKASRSKEYWGIIKDTEYLDVLMKSFAQICPQNQTESMIYGYGTLKFICMDTPVLLRCIELNLIPIMTRHLKILNTEVSSTVKDVPESIFNGTFQLTSILRSVVGEDSSTLDMVVRSGLLEELCNSLHWTIADIDVVSNIVRILSVISMDDTCCQVISRNDYFVEAILRILKLWMSKDDVMVRVTYCLGNLFAKSDEMRVKLFDREEAFQLILNLMSHHVKKPTPVSMDILVKTVRIIANWILNPGIGWEICDDPLLSELLYSILLMNNVTEELVLCVISTMNNTSFYKDYNAVDEYTFRTAEYLFCNLITKDVEVKAEAMKVLGNLTRNPEIRCAAVDYVDNVLHCLDGETDEELLCATCGVLINIIVDERVKSEFLQLNGVDSLLTILRTRNDLAVVMMANQILWNMTISNIESGNIENYGIGEEKKSEIRKLLLMKLQNVEASSLQTDNNMEHHHQMEHDLLQSEFYTDFETVARSLLEKL